MTENDGGAPRSATAFAPGHLTGLFAPSQAARDPRGRGSVGAGLVLELGATATARWTPGPRTQVAVTSPDRPDLPISAEVARRLVADRTGRLDVTIHHDLPIGQGFGMSAAGALATALAVGASVGRSDRRTAVATAHLADLFGEGGLGGVAAILGGGWEFRRTPGVPPWGRIEHRPFARAVWVATSGRPMPSPMLLRSPGFLARVARAAEAPLAELAGHPTAPGLLAAAERFTDRLRLAPPAERRLVGRLRTAGAWSGQAMFGRAVWAVPKRASDEAAIRAVLTAAGVRAVELRAAAGGARLLRRPRSGGRQAL